MKKQKTAAQKYKEGTLTEDGIDAMVERWHSEESGMELYEYIGFTRKEYSDWVMRRLPGPTRETKKRVVARSRKTRR